MEILIIDDEQDICRLLSHYLKRLGIESIYAHTVAEGLEKFDPHVHQIVFLDINLPDGNGLDTVPLLIEKNSHLKVIIISAYDSLKDRNKADEQGAYKFLKKPFSIEQIEDILQKDLKV